MKNIFIILLIIASVKMANSQDTKFYVTGGYNFNFPNASSVNFIIDRYNETRSYLTTKMDNINTMSGVDFSIGGIVDGGNNGILFEAGVTFKNSGEKYAEGTVSGTEFRRDFKAYNFMVNLGFGYLFNYNNSVNYGLGLFVDIGSIKYETRVYDVNDSPPDYTDITPTSSTLALGFTPAAFLNFNFSDNIGISIRPYYLAQLFSQDLEDVNVALNPNTWQNDDPEDYNSETFSGFGVDLKGVVSF